MHEIICDAIHAKRLLRFVYEGYERIVEPHVHGINTADHEMLSGWLVGGWSGSKPEPGWRNFLVRDMHDVHALADGFEGPRARYNAFDKQMRQVFCRLEPSANATEPAFDTRTLPADAQAGPADMPPPNVRPEQSAPRPDDIQTEPPPPAA
jgi:hypothetical protein